MIMMNPTDGTGRPLAWLWMLCLSAGCASPQRAHVDRLLLTTLQHVIVANEAVQGCTLGGQVVQTRIVSAERAARTEEWFVKRGDRVVVYTVILRTRRGGDTEYEVILPESDRGPS